MIESLKNYKLILISVLLIACNAQERKSDDKAPITDKQPVAYSLSGEPFYEPERSREQQTKLEANLAKARSTYENDSSEMNYIWLGRRTAYLSHYPEAIEIFTSGIATYPESYKLLRHRGHRYISIRKFDLAIADLSKAADLMPKDTIEIEPDGIPNKLNQPLSSTQFNVWYHLALAHYLKGDYKEALKAYRNCMETSINDDLKVATADWMYMTLNRLSMPETADSVLSEMSASMNIIENDSYYQRLLMYKGLKQPDEVMDVSDTNADRDLALATQGYGVANYYLMQGDTSAAKQIFKEVLAGKHWAAFGFIAAEADIERLN